MIIKYGLWDMSIAETFMTQTIYLSNLAWDYGDAIDPATKNRYTFKSFPTLLEFMASGLCPSQSLGSCVGHLTEFLDYIYQRNVFATQVSVFWPTVKTIGMGIMWIAIYVPTVARYPVNLLYTDFSAQPFGVRVFHSVYDPVRIDVLPDRDRILSEGKILHSVQVDGCGSDDHGPVFQRI